jgi:hypothetical protein
MGHDGIWKQISKDDDWTKVIGPNIYFTLNFNIKKVYFQRLKLWFPPPGLNSGQPVRSFDISINTSRIVRISTKLLVTSDYNYSDMYGS